VRYLSYLAKAVEPIGSAAFLLLTSIIVLCTNPKEVLHPSLKAQFHWRYSLNGNLFIN
jgi:hypothetical protein